jgi:uncharacterized protein
MGWEMVTVADGTVTGRGYDVIVLDDDGRILPDHQHIGLTWIEVVVQREPLSGEGIVKLDRATVCLPIKERLVSHAFYTALGFAAVGELGDDGLPGPLQFEISAGLRVMLIPSRGFGWVIGDRKRSPRDAHECLVVIGLATDAAVDELMRRAQDAGAEIVFEAGNQK